MKKLLFLTVAMIVVAGSSFAQYKPEAKSIGTEVQFNPFDQNGKTFKLDGLKVRYFITAKDAVRLKVGFGLNKEKVSYNANDFGYDVNIESNYKATSGDFNLDFGYERHFEVAKRLSVYVGGSVGFNRHFAHSKWDFITGSKISTLKTRNGIYSTGGPYQATDRGSWGLDAAIFTGLDFYVYKGLYIGTEFGLGLKTSKAGKIKATEEVSSGNITEITEIEDYGLLIDNTAFGFYIEPTLRLGWMF